MNLEPEGGTKMRFLILVKASKDSEAGVLPDERLFTEMGQFNEELVKAGVMRTVIDGPFAETKELIAGFWIWQVKSREEAIEWVKRIPNPTGDDGEVEIRQVSEADDLGEGFTPELREQDERRRAQAAAKA